jgi:hypothetical protein
MLVGRAWCFITLVMPSRDVTVAMLAVGRAEAFVATRSECVAACRSELVVVKVIARMQQKQPATGRYMMSRCRILHLDARCCR